MELSDSITLLTPYQLEKGASFARLRGPQAGQDYSNGDPNSSAHAQRQTCLSHFVGNQFIGIADSSRKQRYADVDFIPCSDTC
jgi:hypothetical protein